MKLHRITSLSSLGEQLLRYFAHITRFSAISLPDSTSIMQFSGWDIFTRTPQHFCTRNQVFSLSGLCTAASTCRNAKKADNFISVRDQIQNWRQKQLTDLAIWSSHSDSTLLPTNRMTCSATMMRNPCSNCDTNFLSRLSENFWSISWKQSVSFVRFFAELRVHMACSLLAQRRECAEGNESFFIHHKKKFCRCRGRSILEN